MHKGPPVATEIKAESKKSTPGLAAFPDKTLNIAFCYCLPHQTPDLLPPLTFPPVLFFNDDDFRSHKLQGKKVFIQTSGTIACSSTQKVCRK